MLIYLILIISIMLNLALILKFYQDRRVNLSIKDQLNWISKGNALSKLKYFKSSSSHDKLIDEINQLVYRLSTIQIEFEQMTQQNKRMISSISHDFRTPLTSMLGYVQILKSNVQTPKEEKYLNIVEERTRILSELVDEFYRLSILESGEYHFHMENVYPIILVQEQVAIYYEELAETFDYITIQLMEENINLQTCVVDFNRLIGNLIKNAFTHGTNRFSMYNELSVDTLIIYIENQVENPSSIDVNRLFERLYKVDETRTTTSTGLGLSISKTIAEALGYTLEADLRDSILQFKLTIPTN